MNSALKLTPQLKTFDFIFLNSDKVNNWEMYKQPKKMLFQLPSLDTVTVRPVSSFHPSFIHAA